MKIDRYVLECILELITVPYGWRLEAEGVSPNLFLRVVCNNDRCNVTGEEMSWNGRKWPVSMHACESEIVQTALKAVLTAVEHETREKFLYRGRMIYGPHLDVNALIEIADRIERRAA